MNDQAAMRSEAVRLLRRLAAQEEDPGAAGYAQGMAERLTAAPEPVTAEYVAGLRRAVGEAA